MVRIMRMPLFPLQMVLLPGIPAVLHIFEPRYRRMIRDCIQEKEDFGIVLYQDTDISKTGCTASIEGIITEYPDGRFDILVAGRERFKVNRFFEDKEYLEAEVELFNDLPAWGLNDLKREAAEGLLTLSALENFPVESENLLNLTSEETSLLIAGTELFTTLEKQELLESTDTVERLERINRRIQERIRSRRAIQKVEDLLGGQVDFTVLRN